MQQESLTWSRWLILSLLLSAVINATGCREVDCRAYDFEHPAHRWNLFPDTAGTYRYTDGDTTIALELEDVTVSNARTIKCHMCYCGTDYDAGYRIGDALIRSTSGYDDLSGRLSSGGVSIEVEASGMSARQVFFSVTEDGAVDTVGNFRDPENLPLPITFGDTLRQGPLILADALAIELPDASGFERLFVVRDSGLVAFEQAGQLWTKE